MNRKITDKLATGMFGLCAAIIAAILVGLFSYIIINGVSQAQFSIYYNKIKRHCSWRRHTRSAV